MNAQNDPVLDATIEKLINARTYTLQVAELMPAEDYSFKPTEEMMSFSEQLIHLSRNLGWLSTSYLGSGANPITKEDMAITDKDLVMAKVETAYDLAIETLREFNMTGISDTVQFFAGPKTKVQIINLLHDHQTHHRGQVLVYLRLKGIKPPRYVGW
jgi:uncharacterized damage-inducible protein DinB